MVQGLQDHRSVARTQEILRKTVGLSCSQSLKHLRPITVIKPTLRSAVSSVRRAIQEPLTGFKRELSEVLYYTLGKAEFQAFTDTFPQI